MGQKGNYEAQQAKKVSNILNVPWIFVKTGSRQARNLYLSKRELDIGIFQAVIILYHL